MPDSTLTLKPATPTPAGKKAAPTSGQLAPWQFEYAGAKDGRDANLVVMFHGLGDTKAAFARLGREINLPSTAVLSLQAPIPIPLLDHPAWSWYNTFDPLFNPLPNPDPSVTLAPLRKLLASLTVLGWSLPQIHLFGWGQGGTMALELALSVGREPIVVVKDARDGSGGASGGSAGPSSGATGRGEEKAEEKEEWKRLGSVVSVCASLESFPSAPVGVQTPALWFNRLDPRAAATQRKETALKRAFARLEVVRGEGQGEGMPRGQAEWWPIMKFWGQVLARGDEGWKGSGDVYEVVQK